MLKIMLLEKMVYDRSCLRILFTLTVIAGYISQNRQKVNHKGSQSALAKGSKACSGHDKICKNEEIKGIMQRPGTLPCLFEQNIPLI